MKIIPASAVIRDSSSTPTGVVRVDVVKKDTFNYFLQKPKDRFTADDKAIVIKLIQSLQSNDLKVFVKVACKDVAIKIAEIETLATRQDIDLAKLDPYEARAQQFAKDVINVMKTWTLQVQREALHVAELSGTTFAVTLQNDEPCLAAIDLSPLDKEFSSSPDPLELTLKGFKNEPPDLIFNEDPYHREHPFTKLLPGNSGGCVFSNTIGAKPISGHVSKDDLRAFLSLLSLKSTKALEAFRLTGVEKRDFPFASTQHELGHAEDDIFIFPATNDESLPPLKDNWRDLKARIKPINTLNSLTTKQKLALMHGPNSAGKLAGIEKALSEHVTAALKGLKDKSQTGLRPPEIRD